MYLEYEHKLDHADAKSRIDTYIDKLDNLQFSGGFFLDDLKKSWTGDEMQVSFNLKKMVIDRRTKANIRLKEHLLIMDADVPTVVQNFITEENLKKIILRNLDTIFQE